MQEQLDSQGVKRAASDLRKNQLESRFLEAWRAMFPTLPMPVMQHKFHPQRKWRFDFSWPDLLLAVELNGASFGGGRHNRGAEQAKDYEKMRHAIKLGWRVLPFGTKDMDHPYDVVEFVAEVMTNAKETA